MPEPAHAGERTELFIAALVIPPGCVAGIGMWGPIDPDEAT
jgi:hypothetical protein